MAGKSALRIECTHLPNASGVYAIVCVPTGETYIGSSVDIYGRAYGHACNLAYGEHKSKSMQSRYDELGPDAFRFDIIDLCELEELSPRETAWIKKLAPIFNTHQRSGVVHHLPRASVRRHPQRVVRRDRVRLSHESRRERRMLMVEAFRSGDTVGSIAATFNVSGATVHCALREHGIRQR